MPRLTCERCEKPFEVKPYRAAKAKFCSQACRRTPYACVHCGRDYKPTGRGTQRYCSRRCAFDSRKRPLAERVLSMVEKTPTCWLWTGAISHGYGAVTIEGSTRRAHRVSYEAFVGPIPKGLELDHLCGNKRCVNPAHLEAVSHLENIRRARAH